MLIQSLLPISVSTELSFTSECGKRQSTDLMCDWPHCGETWQQSLNCDDSPSVKHRKPLFTRVEVTESSTTRAVELSRTSSDLSLGNNMCSSSAPKWAGYVYKRRKLQRNTVALLSEENAMPITNEISNHSSSISFEEDSLVDKDNVPNNACVTVAEASTRNDLIEADALLIEDCGLQKPTAFASRGKSGYIQQSVTTKMSSFREDGLPPASSVGNLNRSAPEDYSVVCDTCLSSKSISGNCSTIKRTDADGMEMCSSIRKVLMKPLEEFSSARDLCIHVLQAHGLLRGLMTGNSSICPQILGDVDDESTQLCKICGLPDNLRNMLICDLCDEAFHISCCHPKVKKLPVDDWYCQPCSRKRPKPLLTNNPGNSLNIMGGASSHGGINSILAMLSDNQPHKSGVRIGRDFQVEVPEWCGPVSIDNDYFGEPSELDLTECASLNSWNNNELSKHSSIGNWVQCRGVIYNDADINDEGRVCGKWRRAPLFVVQTDDWDCFCSVLWDPIHADCAVPQLRPRLSNDSQKTDQSKSNTYG
ncbi:Zinc finger RING/FYVE/PHD-type protein [Dioscorea alata]|uniref:Zinc finger RING/FYVE/PHD-type protein n=2 Tax=Dioscorea alata TaxID=55571 RepID=A0ACB7VKA2_DIOAL|nr:Zinc finger RING/FYVE/PHD-type protein [Dioscorea alata]